MKIIYLIENNKLNIYDLLDIEQDDGYLFHGSKTGGLIGKISTLINKNEPNDFDNGFYLSDSLKNAVSYVIDQNKPVIYRFRKEDVLKGQLYDFSSMKNGEIDRDSLREYLLNSPNKKARLEKFVHSLVSEIIIAEFKYIF